MHATEIDAHAAGLGVRAIHSEGILQLVGTPIGNLGDASPRSIDALTHASVVLAEDTRVTSKLFVRFGIRTPLVRCDEYKMMQRADEVCERIRQGECVALVSDAGMPGISDPGQRLVDAVLDAGLRVEVIPGPSAVTCSVALSGLRCEHFLFYGFLPRKTARLEHELKTLLALDAALVFFESPHRVIHTLAVLADLVPGRRAALMRELTKVHEEVIRGQLHALYAQLQQSKTIRGECVIVVEQPKKEELQELRSTADGETPSIEDAIRQKLAEGGSPSSVARELAHSYGLGRRDVYRQVVSIAQQMQHKKS